MTTFRRRPALPLWLVLLAALPVQAGDVIFDAGLEDASEPAALGASCAPEPPHFPPLGYALASASPLDELWRASTGGAIGPALAQVRVASGTFQSHPFDRTMFPPGDVHMFQGDTSNTGPAAVGAAYRYVAISECIGDLRPARPGHPDPTLDPACRVAPSEGPFLYLNWGPPQPGLCNLDPAKVYVFNVILDDPADGFDATSACNPDRTATMCGFRMSVH
jgi:hypothetical protein